MTFIAGFTRIVFMTYNNLDKYMMPEIVNEVEFDPTLDPMDQERIDRLGPGDHNPSVLEHNIQQNTIDNFEESKGRESDVYLPDLNSPKENSPHYNKPKYDKEYYDKKKGKKRIVNSNIISASINNREETIKDLPEPILYTLEHKTVGLVFCFAICVCNLVYIFI